MTMVLLQSIPASNIATKKDTHGFPQMAHVRTKLTTSVFGREIDPRCMTAAPWSVLIVTQTIKWYGPK